MSHLNIYDTHDDIFESQEKIHPLNDHYDDDDKYGSTYEDKSSEDDNQFGQSGSNEDLNRFELHSSEELTESDEKKEEEKDIPKAYKAIGNHDYNMADKHDCDFYKHMAKTHPELANEWIISGQNCDFATTVTAKAPTQQITLPVAVSQETKVATQKPTMTTINQLSTKECPDLNSPIHGAPQPHCFDDPAYHDPPGSPLKEDKRKLIPNL